MNMRRIVSDEELSASMLAELDLLRSQYVGKFVYFTFPNPSFDCDSEFRIRSERSVERQELLFVLELVATKPNSRVSPCIWPMPMRVLHGERIVWVRAHYEDEIVIFEKITNGEDE